MAGLCPVFARLVGGRLEFDALVVHRRTPKRHLAFRDALAPLEYGPTRWVAHEDG